MKKLLQIDFPFSGPFGPQMVEALSELAYSINEEPGFIWKIWTESEKNAEGGGIYLFESEETARNYLDKHRARLKSFGISEVSAKIFDVNVALSNITNGPIG